MSTPDDLPLRVAIDVGPLYGHRTGVGAAVDGFVQALSETDGVQLIPYLVSFRSDPTDDHHRKLPLPGIVASHVWSRFDHPRADRWLRGADVVHGTNYVAPPTRLPTIVSVYDCWFLAHPEQASPLIRRAGNNLRRAVARGAWVHTSSAATAEHARTLLETDRVVAIHLGPPMGRPRQNAAAAPPVHTAAAQLAGRPFVLAIGTEERRKDLRLLVRAFGLLATSLADVALVLAGAAGDDSRAVDDAILELATPARDLVHRLGVIDDDTKQWLLRHAAVLAYPSLDEGFGFPILEAQAAGTPVVASDVGSVPEVAGAGAVLVADRSPEAFASALRSVMTGETSRLGLIEAGHRNVHHFSWQRSASELRELYRTALEADR